MSWQNHRYPNERKPEIYSAEPRDREWEEYHRRRQWEEYDRDMANYGERRGSDVPRGPSRSPTGDETSRKRRRSPSPWDRARYEPRPRYGDERDFARPRDDYSAPPRKGGFHGYGGRDNRSGRPPPPNPYEQDHPVQLKQFAEWFRYTYPEQAAEEDRLDGDAHREVGTDAPRPRDGIRHRWEKYKKEFLISQVSIMFEHHKKSPWFSEKYDPSKEFVNLRQRVRKEGWRGRLNQFVLELEEGKHDPELAFPELDNSSTDSPKENTNTLTEAVKSDAASGEELKSANQDEDMPFGMDAEDDAGDNDAKADSANKTSYDGKRNSREDEVSVMPEGNEVMIRTIPPDIGRIKLEEVCSSVSGFVHLALGEPLQKRNFYRAGWIKFQDDADMDKALQELSEKKASVDGFKLHVTHTTRPFITRTRITPELASRPERIKKDLAQAKELTYVLEAEASLLRKFSPTQARKSASTENGKVKIESNGENPDHVVSPNHHDAVNGDGVDEADIEAEIESEPKEKGSDIVERRIEKITSDFQERNGANLDDGIGWDAKKATIALDLYRAYLRTAFNTCYYCAAVTDHVEELQRKCVKHVRKSLTSKTLEEIIAARKAAEQEGTGNDEMKTEEKQENPQEKDNVEKMDVEKPKEKGVESREWRRNDERWLDWLDGKIALLINRSAVDPRDYGGKDYDEELSKACEAHIKQEDEGKFRCRQCNKLFKAMSFVEKHVANKHPELIKFLDELVYYNSFALDPHRIQPFAHPPPTVGNSIGPPPQAYGLKSSHWPTPMPDYNHTRGAPPYPPYGPFAPPPGVYGGYPPPPPPPYYDPWAYGVYPPSYPPAIPEGAVVPAMVGGGKRLSDRLGRFADLPSNVEGLPPKPAAATAATPTIASRAPPADAKEDPRALGGRKISYHDIDKAAVGDDVNIELSY